MATKEAWENRAKILAILNSLDTYILSFKVTFEGFRDLVQAILADPQKKNDLVSLLKEDPDYKIETIQAKYNEYKAIYDWLKSKGL